MAKCATCGKASCKGCKSKPMPMGKGKPGGKKSY